MPENLIETVGEFEAKWMVRLEEVLDATESRAIHHDLCCVAAAAATQARFTEIAPRMIRYARDRFKQAEGAGGHEDPFCTRRQLEKKFGHGAWRIAQQLVREEKLVDAGDEMVVHPSAKRIPEMR